MVSQASNSRPPTETTRLLPTFRPRSWSFQSTSSSSESSLTTSSLDSSDSDSAFMPWYLGPDELSPAAHGRDVESGGKTASSRSAIMKAIAVLIIGVFMSNADGSLVLATHSTIASEFNNLEASSWLITAFALAGASFQAISGQLSDIYGRRPLLTISYVLFAVGCLLVGAGGTMWEVILGRGISGAGGSAMGVVTALLISDLVPLRDIAAWQAGLNIAATTGRSLGGPVGGFLADTIGWRWSFAGQAPIFVAASILAWAFLPPGPPLPLKAAEAVGVLDESSAVAETHPTGANVPVHVPSPDSQTNSLSRIDFLGAFLIAVMILAILLSIDLGGKTFPWTHPVILTLGFAAVISTALFVAVEAWWASNPVFPLSLLSSRNIVASYVIVASMTAAQMGLTFSIPLYFQVSQRVSNAAAGAYLFPAVFGNATGSICAGVAIKRTGRYKKLLVFGTLVSCFSYTLLLLRWHGNTSFFEALYIAPSGFGVGIAQTAVFTSIQGSVTSNKRAPAMAGMYLLVQLGLVLGLTGVSSIIRETVRSKLDELLAGLGVNTDLRPSIIERAVSDIGYLDEVHGDMYSAIVESYILGLSRSHLMSIAFCALGMMASALLDEMNL